MADLTGGQCEAGRKLISWTRHDLAAASGTNESTIWRFELGMSVRAATSAKLRAALESKGVRFVADDAGVLRAVYQPRRATSG